MTFKIPPEDIRTVIGQKLFASYRRHFPEGDEFEYTESQFQTKLSRIRKEYEATVPEEYKEWAKVVFDLFVNDLSAMCIIDKV